MILKFFAVVGIAAIILSILAVASKDENPL